MEKGAFREIVLKAFRGIALKGYSEWIEDQYSLKALFLTQIYSVYTKDPSRKSIFPKSSIFDSLQDINFP